MTPWCSVFMISTGPPFCVATVGTPCAAACAAGATAYKTQVCSMAGCSAFLRGEQARPDRTARHNKSKNLRSFARTVEILQAESDSSSNSDLNFAEKLHLARLPPCTTINCLEVQARLDDSEAEGLLQCRVHEDTVCVSRITVDVLRSHCRWQPVRSPCPRAAKCFAHAVHQKVRVRMRVHVHMSGSSQ